MKLIKCLLCFGTLCIFLFARSIYAAVVVDNDGSAYITSEEFKVLKETLNTEIERFRTDLSSLIDGEIASYLARIPSNDGDEATELDLIFPVGCYIIASHAPGYGTWVEVTDATGRALWVDNDMEWGHTIGQAMPLPMWQVEKEKHKHDFIGEEVNTTANGSHSHTIYMDVQSGVQAAGAGGSSYPSAGASAWTPTHQNHTHNVTPEGEVSEVAGHTHEVIYEGKFNGEPNSKVQPYAYVVKMWKRTA